MATATNPNDDNVLSEASLKRTALAWATGWLNRQDTLTVVMILFGSAILLGGWQVYRDMQAAHQSSQVRLEAVGKDAVEKQEKARAEYLQQLAEERARSDQHAREQRESMERVGERLGSSVDRLTEEIRRHPISANP